eukprot:COSAG02_NODE_27251_length_613_cov_1311.350195_1_plen_20_part_10
MLLRYSIRALLYGGGGGGDS